MTATTYPPANRTLAWYANRFTGDLMKPNCGCLHTTESAGWPSYSGGAVAPSITAKPNMAKKRLDWRQHFPLNRSARALVNAPGGVETNTANVIQLELVGTCDPKHAHTWDGLKAGVDYIYWPDAPLWALEDLADFLVWCHKTYRIPLDGPALWLAYPASYGPTKARLSFKAWSAFYGWCGHQHVPENFHGDPGNLPFAKLLTIAKAKLAGTYGAKPSAPVTVKQVVVWAGATLTAIATAAGVTLSSVEQANPGIKNPDHIQPGQTVTLPPGAKAVTPPKPKTSPSPSASPSAKPSPSPSPSAKPSPKPAAPTLPISMCPIDKATATLKPGAKGVEVTRMQMQLKKAGYSQKVTGKYDAVTVANTNKVIKKAGSLGKADGIAGPKTRTKIMSLAGCNK